MMDVYEMVLGFSNWDWITDFRKNYILALYTKYFGSLQ